MCSATTRLRSVTDLARRDPGLVGLVLGTYVLLIVMRGVITLFPMRRIARHLGRRMEETPEVDLPADQARRARRVAWAIRKTAPRTPTNSNCYPQALTARALLRCAGVPSTVYYGAAFDSSGNALETHVWVRSGRHIVTGAPVHRRFAVVSYFADDRRG